MSNGTGGAAFPHEEQMDSFTSRIIQCSQGMTLRDYFAAKADIEVYAPVDSLYRKLGRNPTVNELAELIADVRYIEASFMITRRSQP